MCTHAQAQEQHNTILNQCDQYREDMGLVTDNISVGTAFNVLMDELPEPEKKGNKVCAIQEVWAL